MPLHCTVLHDPDVVRVHGTGKVTRADIEQYLAATISEGFKDYAKLILLGDSKLALSPADLDRVADRLIDYGRGGKAGPVAIVPGNVLNLDMTVLLKQRVGTRPFSIFVNVPEAMRWLGTFQAPAGRAAAPLVASPPIRSTRRR